MKEIFGIYIITDQELRPERSHVEIAASAVQGGAGIVQLRDKSASDRDFYRWALEIREITRQNDAIFIVNDRIDIAVAVEADGVNIGQSDMPVAAVRKVLPKPALIGVSCSNLGEALRAEQDGADYLGFGPVFSTSSKPDAGEQTGLDILREVVHAVSVPVVAIGGIKLNNLISIFQTGAASASIISAVTCAPDMIVATRDLVDCYNNIRA